MLLLGCDFSSAPTPRKPIVLALGAARGAQVQFSHFEFFVSLDAWGEWLQRTSAWIGAFDFPFGLPRELLEHLEWPLQWEAFIAHYASLDRSQIRATFAAFCAARPVGRKFAHRATDGPAGSSPSMKWVNPPVAYMLHAGVPRLLVAGAALPGLYAPASRSERIALEGYPGFLARELIGRRSYKSDAMLVGGDGRLEARAALLASLQAGSTRLGLSLDIDEVGQERVLADRKGDCMDAVLCLMQAAWAAARAASPGPGYGLPVSMDPLEGWIVSA